MSAQAPPRPALAPADATSGKTGHRFRFRYVPAPGDTLPFAPEAGERAVLNS